MAATSTAPNAVVHQFPLRAEMQARLISRRLELDAQRFPDAMEACDGGRYHQDAIDRERREADRTSH